MHHDLYGGKRRALHRIPQKGRRLCFRKAAKPARCRRYCQRDIPEGIRKYSSYDGERASLSTWIYTVTRNTVIDYFRSNKSEEELPEDFSCGDLEEDEFLKKESLHELGKALAELDERSRALIIFRYYKEMTLKEIADRMGISYAYVKILHKSALHDLRTRISR